MLKKQPEIQKIKIDPQPFHISEKKGKESMFNGFIASSLHTLSACTRVVVDALADAKTPW